MLKGSVQENSCIYKGIDQQLKLVLCKVNDHTQYVNRMDATTLLSDFIERTTLENMFEGRQPLPRKVKYTSWKIHYTSKQLYGQKLCLCRVISDSGSFIVKVFVPLS